MQKTVGEVEKEKIISHINGEIDMFFWSYYKKLKDHIDEVQKINNDCERRATHECFLLHARNLSDFLLNENKKYPDDVLASDFFSIQKPPEYNSLGEKGASNSSRRLLSRRISTPAPTASSFERPFFCLLKHLNKNSYFPRQKI